MMGRMDRDYNGAPYNFVPFAAGIKTAYRDAGELPRHNHYEPGRLSGKIAYEIRAEMPILVGGESRERETVSFYEDQDGRKAIPGSTFRGLVRSNMTILGNAGMGEDIQQDHRMMYRDISNSYYKKVLQGDYTETSKGERPNGIQNVRAGYLCRKNGQYIIYGNREDKFYTVSEKTALEKYKDNFRDFIPFFQNLDKPKPFYPKPRKGRMHYIGTKNDRYKPYSREAFYQLDAEQSVIGLWKQEGKYRHKGTVLSSGYMNEKKAFYVIPEMDESKKIPIPEEDIRSFKIDYEMREKQLKNKGYYALPGEGEIKAVFYIQLGGRLYFGFTPRLRVFYDKTIGEGIPDVHKKFKLDYVKSLFGYTDGPDKEAYKSRLAFSDAVLQGEPVYDKEVDIISGQPKATSYRDYLIATGGIDVKNGNFGYNKDFRLRGMKQYWLHEKIVPGERSENKNIATRIQPLKEGAVFRGTIQFDNLSEVELGLLLWSVELEKNSRQNIGRGKAYGYGRCDIRVTEMKIWDVEELYKDSELMLDSGRDHIGEVSSWIRKAKESLGTEQSDSVKNFLLMKDNSQILPNDKIRYMKIKNIESGRNEYQQRKNNGFSLPDIQQVLKGETGQRDAGKNRYQR